MSSILCSLGVASLRDREGDLDPKGGAGVHVLGLLVRLALGRGLGGLRLGGAGGGLLLVLLPPEVVLILLGLHFEDVGDDAVNLDVADETGEEEILQGLGVQ